MTISVAINKFVVIFAQLKLQILTQPPLEKVIRLIRFSNLSLSLLRRDVTLTSVRLGPASGKLDLQMPNIDGAVINIAVKQNYFTIHNCDRVCLQWFITVCLCKNIQRQVASPKILTQLCLIEVVQIYSKVNTFVTCYIKCNLLNQRYTTANGVFSME